jgi:hypothetical protein
MLEENWRFGYGGLFALDAGNTHHGENVAVFSSDLVSFNFEIVFLANLSEREVAVGVGTGLHSGSQCNKYELLC